MILALLPLALFSACSGSDDAVEPACAVELEGTSPVDAASDAYIRAPIEFHLSDPDPLATVSASVPGTLTRSEDGEILYYTPDEFLTPSTAYSASLTWCGGTTDLAFTTSPDGVALADPSILVNRTWSFNLSAARIVHPDGLGSVLAGFPPQPLLVGVTSVSEAGIGVIEAASVQEITPLEQEFCASSTEFPEGDFSEQPFFRIATPAASVSVGGVPVDVVDLEVTGMFAADGGYITGGTLSGIIDTRPMAVLVGGSDPGTVCATVISLGIVCEPCPSDGERYCLSLLADQITAPEEEGVRVVAVAGTDCEGCADGPPEEGATCAE